MQPKEHGNL